jgi:hypothetical protein
MNDGGLLPEAVRLGILYTVHVRDQDTAPAKPPRDATNLAFTEALAFPDGLAELT